jgi:hypothetical protein
MRHSCERGAVFLRLGAATTANFSPISHPGRRMNNQLIFSLLQQSQQFQQSQQSQQSQQFQQFSTIT